MGRRLVEALLALGLVVVPSMADGEETNDVSVTYHPPTAVVLVDGSSAGLRLLHDDESSVIVAMRSAVVDFLAGDFGDGALAVHAYGHRAAGGCADVEAVVPLGPATEIASAAAKALGALEGGGRASIAKGLRAAKEALGDAWGAIVLVAGDVDRCDDDPCALAATWREDGDLRPIHVVGVGLPPAEKKTLKCIADASGGRYVDAETADQLTAGLTSLREIMTAPALVLASTDAAGAVTRVVGTAVCDDGKTVGIANHRQNRVQPGRCQLEAGRQLADGSLYAPTVATVDVAPLGETRVTFVPAEPPTIRVTFRERDQDVQGGPVDVYQDGRKILGFRPPASASVRPGTYELRSQPNADNDLRTTVEVVEGRTTDVTFTLTPTLNVHVEVVGVGVDRTMPGLLSIWQGDEQRYTTRGRQMLPMRAGTYTLRVPVGGSTWDTDIVVEEGVSPQTIRVDVPVGWITLRRPARVGPNDRVGYTVHGYDRDGSKLEITTVRLDRAAPLLPGRYELQWYAMAQTLYLTIEAGREIEMTLDGRKP